MKKLFAVVFAVLFGAGLAFGQGTVGSTTATGPVINPGPLTTSSSGKASGKKGTSKARKGTSGKKGKTKNAHKGGKKGADAGGTTTPAPK